MGFRASVSGAGAWMTSGPLDGCVLATSTAQGDHGWLPTGTLLMLARQLRPGLHMACGMQMGLTKGNPHLGTCLLCTASQGSIGREDPMLPVCHFCVKKPAHPWTQGWPQTGLTKVTKSNQRQKPRQKPREPPCPGSPLGFGSRHWVSCYTTQGPEGRPLWPPQKGPGNSPGLWLWWSVACKQVKSFSLASPAQPQGQSRH